MTALKKTAKPFGLHKARAWPAGVAALLALVSMLALAGPAQAREPRVVEVARGLVNPWALAFLPDGRLLVSERPGRLRIVSAEGRVGPPLQGLPRIAVTGQCGLLDVALDPQFAQNRRIWFSYAEPGDGGNSTALASAHLADTGLTEVRTVFRQLPKVSSSLHCGSRIVFDREGRILLGLGDRFSEKERAQTLDNHIGKVVRLDSEGAGAAAGNPFMSAAASASSTAALAAASAGPVTPGNPLARPEVFSLGHRNIQGAALHPATGELWAVEHGPQGGDELNVVEAGRNYGWPLVTYGRNYGSGTRIGTEGPRPGFEQPLHHWLPTSVAPSGMAFVTTDRYPGWKGSLLIGTLRAQTLIRLALDGRRVVAEERLLSQWGARIRDVREAPDGQVYLLTDGGDGRILRLQP